MNPHPLRGARRRNRGMLVALFVLFFGGMLLAGLLRFPAGGRLRTRGSAGALRRPARYKPTLANGGAWLEDEPRIWRIVVAPRVRARAPPSARAAGGPGQSLAADDQDADRVHVLWAGAYRTACGASRSARVARGR
jgi:hypothetical protein